MNGRIHIKEMVFYGYHGNFAEENKLGQRFLIDLKLTLDIREAAESDNLDATVDYGEVYKICQNIVEHDQVKLLETLSKDILDAIMNRFPRVQKAEILIKKPSVPIKAVLAYVAVEASRER